MSSRVSRTWQLIILGFAAIGAASALVAIAMAGFVTGLVIPALLLGLVIVAGAVDRSLLPEVLRSPTRAEWMAIAGSVAVIVGTAVSAVFIDTYVWVAIPLAGFLAVHSLYGLSQMGQQYLIEPERETVRKPSGVHSSPEVILGDHFEALGQTDIFKSLTHGELEQIARIGAVRSVREGAAMGIEGQFGTSTFAVLRGEAQLSAYSRVGRITARVAGPGESFPLASMLGEGVLITSIQARTDMTVWEVSSSTLTNFFASHPEIAAKVYRATATILAERYRNTLRRLTEQSADVLARSQFWANV